MPTRTARGVSELVCGNFVIGRNTMRPNRKEMKGKWPGHSRVWAWSIYHEQLTSWT